MQNLTNTDYKKMSIDESFKAYKCNFLKAVFIKLNLIMKIHIKRAASLPKF